MAVDQGPDKTETPSWRARVRAVVQDLVVPDQVPWEDDAAINETQFVARILAFLDARFQRPLQDDSVESRLSLAEKLARLPCMLAHPDSLECVYTPIITSPSILDTLTKVMSCLMNGASHGPLEMHRSVLEGLACAVRHHGAISGLDVLLQVKTTAMYGLVAKERSIRMCAGRVLANLVQVYQAFPDNKDGQIEDLFSDFYRFLEVKKDTVKEGVLVTLGWVGKVTHDELLGRVVCCLISQLGRENPAIRGTAFMQLQALSKHRNKSPYGLVATYMNHIAPFLITRMCTQPTLMSEACRLLSVTPTDFVTATLPRTLPHLFASGEMKVLEMVAKETNKKLSTLFLNYSHHILAYIFLLEGPGQTDKGLQFVVKALSDAADNSRLISISSVVTSCILPLLSELVTVLGHEAQQRRTAATRALQKVQQAIAAPPSQRAAQSPTLDTFLGTHVLGLISHLNEMLQDVQGKKSVDTKRQIIRSLGALITQMGPEIGNVAPQIMATLQTMLSVPQLSEVTLQSWHAFVTTLRPKDIGPYVGLTSAAFVASWPNFSDAGRNLARQSLNYILSDLSDQLGRYLDDIVDLKEVPELKDAQQRLDDIRSSWSLKERLQHILERVLSDNSTVANQSLRDLRRFILVDNRDFIQDLTSGDVFDPLVGDIISALYAGASYDGDGAESSHLVAFECIGGLGALDPDRFQVNTNDTRVIVLSNFKDENESVTFALHLIRDLLVGAFRSTSDIRYQMHLAYAIQELLKFCKFTPSLVSSTSSIPMKVRNRWNSLPKHVLESVTPLLESRYTLPDGAPANVPHPIYSTQSTYREWIQIWAAFLITRTSGPSAQTIFLAFRSAVRNKDVGVAHHLLPHLVLNILVSGCEEDSQKIRAECLAVLEDQFDPNSDSSTDKKLLSAQAVFMLLDHLNKWVRLIRQDFANKRSESKRGRVIDDDAQEQLIRVDSILSSIDQGLMAKAALQCKAYARSLMSFERHILMLQSRNTSSSDLQGYYERLHEIYAHLEEPDGMEGVSTLILSPSLEHQIRQHESTGRWTSAQSCWEVRLQQSPDTLDLHLGLIRCLRNLGHYDTLRTHVKGILTRHPGWEPTLAGYQVEGAWMVGDWAEVESVINQTGAQSAPIAMARILLAMRDGDSTRVSATLSEARYLLGAPVIASGAQGYHRTYDAVLDLHLAHELELIYQTVSQLPLSGHHRQNAILQLSRTLSARLDSTLPAFRIREPVLSMRRTAFGLSVTHTRSLRAEIGRTWLASAKIARKAGHWQTAYSSMLHAQRTQTPFSFIESARLIKANGESLRALQELDNSLQVCELAEKDVIDLTEDDEEGKKMKAKAHVLLARWMNDSDRFEETYVWKAFQKAAEFCPNWESAQFHLGRFHDSCFKALSTREHKSRGTKMILQTIKCFSRAIKHGSKYVYQTVPRLLTLWLDMGENNDLCQGEAFGKVNAEILKAIKSTPVYKWYTAFPQIVSRVGHSNQEVYKNLTRIIMTVIQEYPKQALWLFCSVVKSNKQQRESRGRGILDQLRGNSRTAKTELPTLINQCMAMTNELLALCDYPLRDDGKKPLNMSKDFPKLARLAPSRLIIPLQESLTASLPPNSSTDSIHQPFPSNLPTFDQFADDIEIMRSVARPRKITIRGNDGQIYMFLGKPKDDLRKDARLMDFNAIINKLLKAQSESRRRQLHIRTYGVVTLNEECGFIQWVPNTIPIRSVLVKHYDARSIKNWNSYMADAFTKIKEATDRDGAKLFVKDILPLFPPVFHEWFIETFPEPSAWLASRLLYARTAAVMSMVGYILGLGDRHCENILLDTNSGDVVHVDFNCLFEKGKTFETPERVPFRLTQNMVDGLGVTGVEGVFRIASEVTLQLLRDNKDTLMSVLDAFVHDPLVEWEDEKKKMERDAHRRNAVKSSVDLRMLAKNALNPIEKKLKGIYMSTTSRERPEKEMSTNGLVEMLIQEATDPANLGKMYPGWAPWH
ncbi:hypothetical protein JAAARDRAFT_117891 [Jaapia argillacea MUCL 33604]|uniref:non-specific serine/threonine protein kinase n=1 Tax=Jaapia argillacea MUCL 33604 TaxID=933084 RepID=A0A067QB48_9AGAM|nr:hypothetical protein JAAARDRAFT_117891 [Jaapia argillacea MUCL 33604]